MSSTPLLSNKSKRLRELRVSDVRPRQAHDGMKQLVNQRTAELRRTKARLEEELAERGHAEEAQRVSEHRLRATMDSMLEGCQIIGFDWRYLYVNDTVAVQGRQTKDALLGHTMMEVYPGIEDTELFVALRRCVQERTPVRMENQFTFPDGSLGWFDLSLQPVPEGVFILSHDITAQKRAHEKIQTQVEHLQALRAIDIAIVASTDRHVMLNVILEEVIRELRVDAASVLLLNSHSHKLEYVAGHGFRKRVSALPPLQLGEGFAGRAALERRMVSSLDLASTQEVFKHKQLLKGEDFVAVVAAPLIAKGRVVGVVNVFSRSPLGSDPDWIAFFETLAGQLAIAVDSSEMFEKLQRSNVDLLLAYDTTIEGWSRALDLRDKETEGHTQRVTELTLTLAGAMGLSAEELVHVRRGALLHDIGKMGVPDNILLKPGPLTDDEWVMMKKHPTLAYEMLVPIAYLRPALDIPYCHHEKWDGTGYPRGLKGEQIPLSARLFAAIDVWDALRSDRPYRAAWPEERVRAHVQLLAGSHFDPKVVANFLRIV